MAPRPWLTGHGSSWRTGCERQHYDQERQAPGRPDEDTAQGANPGHPQQPERVQVGPGCPIALGSLQVAESALRRLIDMQLAAQREGVPATSEP